jgi:hypothetical protein
MNNFSRIVNGYKDGGVMGMMRAYFSIDALSRTMLLAAVVLLVILVVTLLTGVAPDPAQGALMSGALLLSFLVMVYIDWRNKQ